MYYHLLDLMRDFSDLHAAWKTKTGWNQICNLDNKDPYMWLSVNDETLSVDFFIIKYIVFTCQIKKETYG